MVTYPTDGGKTYVKCIKDKINDLNLRSFSLIDSRFFGTVNIFLLFYHMGIGETKSQQCFL